MIDKHRVFSVLTSCKHTDKLLSRIINSIPLGVVRAIPLIPPVSQRLHDNDGEDVPGVQRSRSFSNGQLTSVCLAL